MKLKGVILSIIIIEVATKRFVKGLQCYVCEDCNEYEDFKELHICGEIPVVMTVKPFTQTEILDGSTTRKPIKMGTSVAPSSKPSENTTVDDYLDEEGDEALDVQNSKQKNVTRKDSIQTTTSATQKSTTLKTTTQSMATNSGTTVTKETDNGSKPSTSTTGAITTTKPLPDYGDYMDYEDPLKLRKSVEMSLLKISEPVCYMIRYHANNTIITNRGCTSYINANKYLTCQTLYNGAPMESCRICSSNGCNKFLDDDSYDDNYDILLNAAAEPQYFGILLLLLWVILSLAIM